MRRVVVLASLLACSGELGGCGRGASVEPGASSVIAPLVVVEEATLAPSSAAAGRRLGRAIAVSDDGSLAVVGAPDDSVGASLAGAAHVFARSGASWAEIAVLRAAPAGDSHRLGSHVAISGDGSRIAVGAPEGGPSGSGAVHVFVRSGGSWIEEAVLVASDAEAGDGLSAVSLSTDGATLLAGAPNDSIPGCASCGSARVFVRSGSSWTEQAMLVSPGAAAFELTGFAVDLSGDGDRALVGVPREDTFVVDAGGARVFVRAGAVWAHEASLTHADAASSDRCGLAVSISRDGTRAALGCPFDDVGGASDAGSVRLFERSTGSWLSEAALAAADADADDNLGLSVGVRANGTRVVAGAPRDDVGALGEAGSVRVFDLVRASWAEQEALLPGALAASDAFGRSVAIVADGARVVAGADAADTSAGVDSGRAWAFTLHLSRGAPCEDATACDTGLCVDGVCCDTTCGGGAADCQACSAALTGGADGTCAPLSTAVAPTIVCRVAADLCDLAETCAAGSPACPADSLAPAGGFCRTSAGPCDVAERCTGTSAACPGDGLAPVGTACRAAAGLCDVVESCSGTSAACPDDGLAAAGTACRPATGVCDVAEACSGASPDCLRNRFQPDGTSCANATRCDGEEVCAGGSCAAGAPLVCDDGDLCTADACDAAAGCAHEPVLGCCSTDSDCADADACTDDVCSGPGGTCSHSSVPGCVALDAGVALDADAALDAGASDAGERRDGAVSLLDGGPDADLARRTDAGGGGPSGGGCSCRATGRGAPRGLFAALALSALGLLAARPRRR